MQKEKRRFFFYKEHVLSVSCLCCSLFLFGCQQRTMSVVSAGSSSYHNPYISKHAYQEKEYISALMAAQKEASLASSSSTHSVDAMLSAQPVSERRVQNEAAYVSRKEEAGQQGSASLSLLWGRPPGAIGEGVTLMNPETRKRLNDALSTTPLESEARWRYGSRQFVFMPNGKVYQPFRTGGRCRDAILIHYDTQHEEQKRGLFCQKGLGSDWLLVR